jgi:predicted dehydrogenase
MKMTEIINLVVVGAGLVGLRHINAISQQAGVTLAGVVEPNLTAEITALGVPCFEDLGAMFETISPDGVILSTPTPMHVSQGLTCIENGCPILVEKPLATSASEAKILTDAASAANVALLVGHHRRHNPLIQKASELISNGAIGEIRAAQVTCWFYKPDDYFDIAPWRKQKGAGPISVNLVHDVDLMRHFCGEVVSVQAQMAPSRRGFENEDLAAAVLRFESGAIGTITVSDSIVSPWSWELTSREYPIYPTTSESCYLLGGSQGSLSVPDLTVWSHQGDRNWWNPISGTVAPRPSSDPLINQIGNFADVIRGDASPVVSGIEGLKTMLVIEAIQKAAESQVLVNIPLFSDGGGGDVAAE